MDHEQDPEQRAADMMHLNAMALEETEQSLHAGADRRTDKAAGDRLHQLATDVSNTAGQIASRARKISRNQTPRA